MSVDEEKNFNALELEMIFSKSTCEIEIINVLVARMKREASGNGKKINVRGLHRTKHLFKVKISEVNFSFKLFRNGFKTLTSLRPI